MLSASKARWVFACGTEFHLFIAYMLSSLAPEGTSCVLILENNHRIKAFLDGAKQVSIWDHIEIINDHQQPRSENLLLLEENEAGRFFYFSWGFAALTKYFVEAVRNGWTICLADEGFNTYQPKTALSKWLALGEHHETIAKGFDLNAVEEIWLMSPSLFLEQTDAKIVPINTGAFVNKLRSSPDSVAEFRRFFQVDEGWSNNSFSALLFLRQYFSALDVLAEPLDAYLDKEFIKVCSPLGVCIKDHPAHRNSSYETSESIIDYRGPLEALVVARYIAGEPLPDIFVSPLSSALINCAAFGIGSKFIFLYKIIEKYSKWSGPSRETFLSRCSQSFSDLQFYIPETWDDYVDIIVDCVPNSDLKSRLKVLPLHSVDQDLRVMNAMLLECNKNLKRCADALMTTEVKFYFAECVGGNITSSCEGMAASGNYALSCEVATLVLTIPSTLRLLGRLRLDIASAPAAITLHTLSLHHPDGTEIWRWDGSCELFVNQADMVCLPDDEGVLILSLSNDPRCELNLAQDVLSRIHGGCYMRLELTARPLLDVLPGVLSRLLAKPEVALPASMRPQLPASAAGQLAELGELLKTVVERKNATIAAQKAEIQAMHDRQNALYEQLVRAEAQLDLLKQLVLPEAGSRLERL